MRSKPEKTLADYLAIAVGPVLIMALVGSLVFFMLQVAYRGDNPGPIRWTLFWFILAAVLVSRISIQNGSTQGWVYGVALGIVTGMMMASYVDWVIGCWVLLALAWWFVSKLTWDCTLVGEEQDTSGEGLLSASGLERLTSSTVGGGKGGGEVQPTDETGPGGEAKRVKEAKKGVGVLGVGGEMAHRPGKWVVYFSMAALPLFGLGQVFIPRTETAQQEDAFVFVLVYVMSALGLLLSTSFLNLRRYLRQRGLAMPGAMAAGWVARGVVLAVVMIGFAVLLPRPQAGYSLTALLDRVERKIAKDESGEDSSLQGVERSRGRRGQGAGRRGQSGDSMGQGAEEEGAGRGAGMDGGKVAGRMLSMGDGVLTWLKYLIYALLALAALRALYPHREALWRAMKEILRGWMEFFRRLMAWNFSDPAPVRVFEHKPPSAVSVLDNPFRRGVAGQRSLEELAECTLRAVEAYAKDYELPRREDQTPLEFMRQISAQWPEHLVGAVPFGEVYSRVAYGNGCGVVPEDARAVMERMWNELENLGAAR